MLCVKAVALSSISELTVAAVMMVPAVYGDTARLYVPEPLRAMLRVLHDRMPALCYGRGMIALVAKTFWHLTIASAVFYAAGKVGMTTILALFAVGCALGALSLWLDQRD
jgi:hypothetical protein